VHSIRTEKVCGLKRQTNANVEITKKEIKIKYNDKKKFDFIVNKREIRLLN
jgi:hypothetical protein